MKIITKYKDYYDYLSGIYGVDNKIILDRRKHKQHEFFDHEENKIWTLLICGKRIDFVYHLGKFIYLDDLEKYYKKPKWRWINDDGYSKVEVDYGNSKYGYSQVTDVYTEIIPDKSLINKLLNCPIILTQFGRVGYIANSTYLYPKLSDLQFNKVMDAKELYLILSEYLAPKDIETKELTNKEKIISKGFDFIFSFRKIK